MCNMEGRAANLTLQYGGEQYVLRRAVDSIFKRFLERRAKWDRDKSDEKFLYNYFRTTTQHLDVPS